jgi:hypothetical protein
VLPEWKPCETCTALKWPGETAGVCCADGKVLLEPLLGFTPAVQAILDDAAQLKHIRGYNSIFAFTSIGTKLDKSLANANQGVYTYRIQGGHYHSIGNVLPAPGNQPEFSQIYFMDSDPQTQANRRSEVYFLLTFLQ